LCPEVRTQTGAFWDTGNIVAHSYPATPSPLVCLHTQLLQHCDWGLPFQ